MFFFRRTEIAGLAGSSTLTIERFRFIIYKMKLKYKI